MEKKDYISNNLYKMTRNNAEFKPHDNNSASVSAIAGEKSEPVSKAQLRRLSDVYNAKLDLMARLERSLKKLSMLNDDLENIIAKRRQASDFLRSKLSELQQLTEPDGGRELHEYLREVEHLRMEYFRMETEIERKSALNSVEEYAENILGMQKLDKAQIEYLSLENGNVIEISEDSDNIFVKAKHAIEDFVEYLRG